VALDLYNSCRLSGVAAPGLEMGSSNPPSFSTAATSSAQTSERGRGGLSVNGVLHSYGSGNCEWQGRIVPAQKKLTFVVFLGQITERAMAVPENGLPTQLLANLSIFCSCIFEHPSCK